MPDRVEKRAQRAKRDRDKRHSVDDEHGDFGDPEQQFPHEYLLMLKTVSTAGHIRASIRAEGRARAALQKER
jgi:hypothetical protein